MEVQRIIIHELEKEAKSIEVKYKSSDSLIDIDSGIGHLVTEVQTSFEKSLTKYSKYDVSNTTNAVYLNSNNYLEESNDENFIRFSKASLVDLAEKIKREPFATGGYYVFIDFVDNSTRYISIVILRNKEAFNIKWNKNKFSVDATENINIDKLAMGFRLNCNLYKNKDVDERNYIALVSNQGDELSKYFTKWVNADKVTSNQANTKNLVNVIKDLGPQDTTTSSEEFERNIYDWINLFSKQNDGKIDIDKLSDYLYKDPLKVRNYAQEKFKKEIDPIFKINTSELNRLIRLRATTKGISVSIDTDKFENEEVQILNGTLIIKNSVIVDSIIRQRKGDNG